MTVERAGDAGLECPCLDASPPDRQTMALNVGSRLAHYDVTALIGEGGRYPGQFYAVHSIAVDSRGNIYTGETLEGKRLQRFVYQGM